MEFFRELFNERYLNTAIWTKNPYNTFYFLYPTRKELNQHILAYSYSNIDDEIITILNFSDKPFKGQFFKMWIILLYMRIFLLMV